MTKFTKTASSTAIAAVVALFSVGGNATIIDSGTNNPLVFSWSHDTGTSLLTGNGSLTVSGFNSSTLTVNVALTNTSLLGGQGGERLTAFGFGIDPNATGVGFVDAADGGMVDASLSFIPSLAAIEVCAYGGQNCKGGSNGGIYGAGGTDSFSILLSGLWGNSVDIAPIGFKYQTGYGSFEFTTTTSSSSSSGAASSTGGTASGSSGTTTSSSGTTTSSSSTTTSSTSGIASSTSGRSVPEPATLGLLGIGLIGQAFLLRQRRRRLQK